MAPASLRLLDRTVYISELNSWCRDRMAGYKVPRIVEFLPALPLNATGKVMKSELR